MTDAHPPESDQSPSGPAHTAAYAAIWGSGFLILRIFAVSGYHWDTAFAVSTTLSLDDGVSLLFGSLMAGHLVTSILLMGVLPLLIAARVWGSRPRPVLVACRRLVWRVWVAGWWAADLPLLPDKDDCHGFAEEVAGHVDRAGS